MTLKLPLRHSETETGSVDDADGDEVFVIDVHRQRPDEEVTAIANQIVDAVNAMREL